MANSYVTINGKQYAVRFTRYEPTVAKTQVVHVTVGGSHCAQDFSVFEYRWGYNLRVPYTGAGSDGGMSDLKTAYALSSCLFTDHYGQTYNVFFEGPLLEMPDSPMIDASAVFTVQVNLRKKIGIVKTGVQPAYIEGQ